MSNEDLYHIVNEIDYQNKTLNMEDNNTKAADKAVQDFGPAKSAKTRTPKSPDSITKGALKMPLQDRVNLRAAIDKSIMQEVELRELQAKEAKDIANGLQ